jgi:hypothetical protein
MIKVLISFFVFATAVYANTSLFYKVHKGNKVLGYYEINYKKSDIKVKSYGVASKVSFFIDKKISYINAGTREMSFTKNKKTVKFNVQTKLDLIDKKTQKKYQRKLKKVKKNDMLLLTKVGKNSIELFNKRKINLITLDEVLKLVILKKIKKDNIILFGKSGVMKMIAKIVPTTTGFDIINKSKGTKYIQVIVKNNIPVEVKSYVSDWSLKIYGAGQFKTYKISADDVKNKAYNIVKNNLSSKSELSITGLEKVKIKKNKYIVYYKGQINYPSDVTDKKRFCNKTYKKYSKKASNIKYNDNNCQLTMQGYVKKKEVIDPYLKDLTTKYEQLKFTKKYKVSKKHTIMYKLIDKI